MSFEADFAAWVVKRKAEARAYQNRPATGGNLLWPGRRNVDGSYASIYRKLIVRSPLPMPRVVLQGPKWRQQLMPYRTTNGRMAYHPSCYDFFPDVRELVCEPVQFDRVAMWADPRERL
jgi:hypothetical protein